MQLSEQPKPIMDVSAPPRPAAPPVPGPEPAPKTAAPVPMPSAEEPAPLAVHEAPTVEDDDPSADKKTSPDETEAKEATPDEQHPAETTAPKKVHNGQPSATGVVVTTIFIMLLLAGLTILVYVKSK